MRAAMIHCQVEGRDVARDCIMKRVMNFGQQVSGLDPLSWSIQCDRFTFIDLLRVHHARVVAELLDDESFDDGTDAVTNELRARGWPSLECLVECRDGVLLAYLRRFLLDPLLDALTCGTPETAQFQINSFDDLQVTASWIQIAGTCYRSSINAARHKSVSNGERSSRT